MKRKRALPRRLRMGAHPGPRWIITVPAGISVEMAEQIARQWNQAERTGVAMFTSDIKVERGRR